MGLHRKITELEKIRANQLLNGKRTMQIIDEYDAGKIEIYLEALEKGHIKSAARVFEWTLDTHLREQAFEIIHTLDMEKHEIFPVIY